MAAIYYYKDYIMEPQYLRKVELVWGELNEDLEIFANSPERVAEAGNTLYKLKDKPAEEIVIFGLNNKHKVSVHFLASRGTLTEALAHPREIFVPLLISYCSSFVMVHNHPSEDHGPSREDKALAERLFVCGKMLGIKMLDFVIIGGNNVYSMMERGELQEFEHKYQLFSGLGSTIINMDSD